ncbi:IclR family transcriptional regulator [Hydrogenivirga caldilitoris]|uniref:IclR family transcriptional regulator n=1 Tax=Hydrogenivirga caldilitoris TaxID=246264 RepID=A0A497XPW4_9AQUI|nr:IclR family transcriptional regulator [Hydrogenivirga caldilitoris]RLJ70159.1 IclR family transcriptional regulator [Hydrogenivirga caldilitoris]
MKALKKTLDVLDFLMNKGTAGVTEISNELNLNKNNVFRILVTLEEHKLVEKEEETEKYKLSTGCVVLGYGFIHKHPLTRLSMPVLKGLRFRLGESVNLAMLDDKQQYIIYVASEETIKPVKVKPREGRRYRINSPVSSAKAIRRALRGEMGFAFDHEYDEKNGIAGGACVIRDYKGRPIGAVEVLAPTYRMPLDVIDREIKPLLEDAALDISLKLGYWD